MRMALLLATLAARLYAAERIEALEPHMGTMFRFVLYADDAGAAHTAIRAAFDRVADLDSKLSDYIPDSELNRIATTALNHNVAVSNDLYTVVSAAQSLAERTHGAFDITLGPLIRLWREARLTGLLPVREEIAAALHRTGFRSLHLSGTPAHPTIRLDMPNMQLDLGAIAKGYAADECLRVLREHGFPVAFVAASGDIAFGDAPPGQVGWQTGIDSVDVRRGAFTEVLRLNNQAVSTSGDTEQNVEIGGVRYSHIVNPITGKGLTQRIGVTVVAAKGIDSDALATAASVITYQHGPEAALRLIESVGAKGVIVVNAGGKWEKYQSRGGL